VAYLGFAAYVTIFVLLLLEKRSTFLHEYGMLAVLGISLFGFMFHSYLTFVSISILQKVCPWCVITNFSMGVIMIATFARVIRKYVLVSPNQAN
jgi:uncharacterized membrane protein